MPDGFHLCVERCHVPGCKGREKSCIHRSETEPEDIYNLRISRPMTLKCGFILIFGKGNFWLTLSVMNTILSDWLEKYAQVTHLNAWNQQWSP